MAGQVEEAGLGVTDIDNHVVVGLAPEVAIKDHYWVCADTGATGNAVDFLVRVKGLSFNAAIKLLLADMTHQGQPFTS